MQTRQKRGASANYPPPNDPHPFSIFISRRPLPKVKNQTPVESVNKFGNISQTET